MLPLSRCSTATSNILAPLNLLSLIAMITTRRPSTLLLEYNHPIPEIPIPESPSHRLESPQERYDVPALREGKGPEGGRLDQGEGDVPVQRAEARMKGSQFGDQRESAAGSRSEAGVNVERSGAYQVLFTFALISIASPPSLILNPFCSALFR
jgi:hypothetical protein